MGFPSIPIKPTKDGCSTASKKEGKKKTTSAPHPSIPRPRKIQVELARASEPGAGPQKLHVEVFQLLDTVHHVPERHQPRHQAHHVLERPASGSRLERETSFLCRDGKANFAHLNMGGLLVCHNITGFVCHLHTFTRGTWARPWGGH